MQRQVASECLFFIAYHTQLEISEVASLIDLIRDLTNGSTSDDGLPILEPWSDDFVPSPHVEAKDLMLMSSPWERQQQQQQQQQQQWQQSPGGTYWNDYYPPGGPLLPPLPPKRRDAGEWEDDLVASLWRFGRPQLLQCVSSLIMSVVCAFDVRHVLVDRKIHGPNDFGIGNALLPPPGGGGATTTTIADLLPVHRRLDPDGESAVEENWRRRDVWGLLLVPYALLLRDYQHSALPPSPALRVGGVMDVRGTYTQCLTVASQLKSLTFARLTLLPSLSSSLSDRVGGGYCSPSSSSSIYDFYLSTLSEFTAQYVDALGATGNFPITRREWLDEETNSAQSEWMEKEQARQFGEWTGQTPEEVNDDDDDAHGGGPKAANVMDRPDCLEDVFALVSSVCEAYPAGSGAFWYVVEKQEDGEGEVADALSTAILAPSRALQTLDLRQSDNDSSLCVYLTFLASLALADSVDGGLTTGGDGAAMVHSYLSGNRAINPHSTDLRIHFLWNTIISSIRWYAENLSPSDDEGLVTPAEGTNKSAKIRLSSNSDIDESSSSYYYGVGGGGVAAGGSSFNADGDASSPLSERRSSPSTAGVSTKMELDELGRNTLMALLCLVANVTSKCHAARVFVLGIQLPASDSTESGGFGYHDGSLEILFSLLTITSLPPEIMGMTFVAIANLLQPSEACTGATLADSRPNLSESDASAAEQNNVSIAGARRAWELMEMCQFVPIKLLSQYSSNAAGAGSMPVSSLSNFTIQKSIQSSSSVNDLPSSIFPKSTDYGMIYQFEHVEAKLGQYHATEGFLFLLSTLIKVVGCPSTLGSQWRLRPGCAPYVEYVTDFVLPRSVGVDKNVQPVYFATVSDECRLMVRALEVIEAVIVRYVVPTSSTTAFNMDVVKVQYLANVKKAKEDMGLAAITSDLFLNPDNLDEEGINSAFEDFRTAYLPPQEVAALWSNSPGSNEMLEASFGNQVPLPKTPGFAILCNLLSSNRGIIFQIILKLLSQNGGSQNIGEYCDRMHSRSLAKSLFRETPPNLVCAREFAIAKAQAEQNIISGKACQKKLTTLQQTLIQSLNPLLRLSYYENSCIGTDDDCVNKSHGAMSNDALLWRERTLLLSLRILCAAAAREEAFIDALKKAGPPISIVPTLNFQGPIHGSFAHRFVHEEKVNVSRLSQLLMRGPLAGHDGRHNSPEILPIITQFVGYYACSLSNHQIIARCAFSIVSYITHTLPHADCMHSLLGSHDEYGFRLANAFSKGLSYNPLGEASPSAPFNIQDAILDLILSNINIFNSASNNVNISIIMLGLSGESKHNCLEVVLDLIANCDFVLDPRTSKTATKCFALIYKVCELGSIHVLSSNVRRQQALFMEKLRRTKFWHTQVVRYLGTRGSRQSIFREVSSTYSLEYGHDTECSKRANDFLHSISYLLKGLAVELRFLMEHQIQSSAIATGGMTSSTCTLNNELKSLLDCRSGQPNSLLLTMLIDMPLGQSSNERLHMIEAPSSEALKKSSKKLTDPVDACVGYEIIDIERLFCHFESGGKSISFEKAREWASAWNGFVGRVCAFSHIAQAWSDVVRAALLCSPLVNHMDEPQTNYFMSTRAIIDILCTILSRLLNPSHLDALCHCCTYHPAEHVIAASIEAECAMPLSIAALGLVELLIESTRHVETSAAYDGVIGFSIAEEDVARVCLLIMGAISSCSESSAGMSPNDERAAVMSCALTRMLLYSEDAAYCVFARDNLTMSNINVNAVAHLFRLSTALVFDDDERYGDAHQANNGAIACATRAGLIALFGHLKTYEGVEAAEAFCSKIFALEEVAVATTKLLRMITYEDNDASFLLRQMALFHDGVVLLAKAGVTSKLLEFAKIYLQSERSFLASHLGTDGTARLKPPSLLKGQLSLLNGLLVSPLTNSDRVALAIDSLQLVKIYSGIFDQLTQRFPADIDLTTTFVEALQLTYTSLEEGSGTTTFGGNLLDLDEPLSNLERSVLRITCQLSAFPFPSRLLPPLPMELMNVEATYASQMKNLAINTGNEKSWWDDIPENATKVGQSLPAPPTGSFNLSSQEKFSSYHYGTDSSWSERNYEYAMSSGRCLEVSISILISRANVVIQRGLSTFSIDAVAIAKGICRCSDASRVRIR
ncbi:hypothetical protein ACHAXA_008498 [Cyclostephanos tholiformis]|uniref:HECT-type E3 ubiquitin transferase n=1 Tax=Cyclostephanos tholiformis TaxID=382380 RepID=A0ABD3RCI5_9STRA